MKPRIVLVLSTTGYERDLFVAAARELDVEWVLASDRCHVLDDPWRDGALALRFEDPEGAARAIAEHVPDARAIIPIGDKVTHIAARAAELAGLPHNPFDAAAAARDKWLARERFAAAGMQVPWYARFPADADPATLDVRYPCVVKPLCLSASRGVMRANDPAELAVAYRRLAALLATPELRARHEEASRWILVEGFIPGFEVAVEGLLEHGRLQVLALFDKPDPLDGPLFAETYYVTPSRLALATQQAIAACTEQAARALGLVHGPIHAELRVNGAGPWILECAARSIGGLCSRTLRFGAGIALEELIVRHALGHDVSRLRREDGAAGVLMLPIPGPGVLRGVTGVEAARAIDGVEDVVITLKDGQHLVPLPEGGSYAGFLFARGPDPAFVEDALRSANAALHFAVTPELDVVQ